MFKTHTFTALAAAATLFTGTAAHAAIDTSWMGGDGNWNDPLLWSNGVPDDAGDIARRTNNVSLISNLDINVALAELRMTPSGGNSWTINTNNNSVLTMNSGSAAPAVIELLRTGGGSIGLSLNVDVVIASDLTLQVQKGDNLSATLNLNNPLTGTGNVTVNYLNAGPNSSQFANISSLNNIGSFTVQGGNARPTTTTVASIGSNVTNITKSGDSTLVLTGTNTYTGTTTLSGGITRARRNDSISNYSTTANVSVASGATLALNVGGTNEWTATNIDTLRANASLSSGAILGFDTTNIVSGFTYASNITGGIAIIKLGTNTLNLTGTSSTYTGATTVSAGVLNITHASALGTTAGATSVTSGAALQLDGTYGDLAIGNEALTLNGTGVSSNGALRNLAGDNSWAGVVTVGASGATIRVETGTSLDLSGGVTSSGAGTRPATFAGGGQTTINGMGFNNATALTVTGGTVILNGASGYDRDTTVSGGTLLVNGSIDATGNGVTVGTAGTLGGSGTISRAVVINGTLRPGNSAGTLTIDNSVTLAGTTVSYFELDSTASYDRLLVNTVSDDAAKTFNFAGTLNVIDNGVTFADGQVFDLIDWGANTTVSGTFTTINLPSLSGPLAWKEFSPGVNFDYSTGRIEVIPEPGTLVLAGAGLLLMVPWRRRASL